MATRKDRDVNKSIKVGDISGTGIVVGHGSKATVIISQEGRNEISTLLEKLRDEVQKAPIPDGAKGVLLTKAVPEMQKALESQDPKPGLERGIERINDQLEGAGATQSKVTSIVQTVSKIAEVAGIAVKAAAPFLSKLMGLPG